MIKQIDNDVTIAGHRYLTQPI